MTKTISFILPRPTPSNNVLKNQHYFAYKKMREDFVDLVREVVPTPKTPITRCEIFITRYGSTLMDWDNLYGGFKPLLDALIINLIIADDNPAVVTRLEAAQVKCKRSETQTRVVIHDNSTST